jgi:hypothetical protein
MLKSIFRQLLKFVLVMFVGFSFVTTASAASGAITGNNTFATAHLMGYWKYATSTICMMDVNQSEAWFKFTTNANDRVFASTLLDQGSINKGVSIQILNSIPSMISEGHQVVNPTSVVPFIFANVDSASSQTFYIRVTRGSYAGDFYFPVAIQDRISI